MAVAWSGPQLGHRVYERTATKDAVQVHAPSRWRRDVIVTRAFERMSGKFLSSGCPARCAPARTPENARICSPTSQVDPAAAALGMLWGRDDVEECITRCTRRRRRHHPARRRRATVTARQSRWWCSLAAGCRQAGLRNSVIHRLIRRLLLRRSIGDQPGASRPGGSTHPFPVSERRARREFSRPPS